MAQLFIVFVNFLDKYIAILYILNSTIMLF